MYVFVRTYFIKNYLHVKPIGYFDKKYGETGGKIWRKIPNY